MNKIIQKGDLISRIRDGKDLLEILDYAQSELYKNGPVDTVILEIISYLKLFQEEFFKKYEEDIISTMGLFFKNPTPESLQGLIFDMYRKHIKEKYGEDYTPMQADVIKRISELQHFSFSAPTSTGKSFIFRRLIKSAENDVVIIVPSRALINEFYDRTIEIVDVKRVNVLTFVEKINTKYANRNIFILTPERSRELFKNKSWLNISLFLFDEAQLSDEDSVRGLYFDSIVQRALKSFPNSKYVFAHPFISNPEAQLKRNDIVDTSKCCNYKIKNVGQVFYTHDSVNNKFYHFGSQKELLGNYKLEATFDPIEMAISNHGSVLIYVPKSHIYNKSIYIQFRKYISMCSLITDPEALFIIEQLKTFIGASDKEVAFYYSDMLDKLKHGIVVHHGSMPLTARLILEHFTQKGFCRICFATSTLEQGINMPFDVVYLDRFEASKTLSVKNLIGRAGRSTSDNKFDFGSVIMRPNAMSAFRKIIHKEEFISEVSHLDATNEKLDKKYEEFKEAIKNNEFSDDYNLTNADLNKLKTQTVSEIIPQLLDVMFKDGNLINPSEDMKNVFDNFQLIYQEYLGRELCMAEKGVLNTAIKIMIWKVYGQTFSKICQYRYAYISRVNERRQLNKTGRETESATLKARFTYGCHDIPDKNLYVYPLISSEITAKNVDYDLIVYDTYDFLDKLIGFKLSDIFYAAFHQFAKTNSNQTAEKLAKYIKYGTDNETHIWMLRYGLTFEDIEWLEPCIFSIDEEKIQFNQNVHNLTDEQFDMIQQYIHDDNVIST